MFEQFELAADARAFIHLVWVAPLALGLCAWSMARRARTLAIFGYDPARSAAWVASLRKRRWLRAGLLAASILLLTAATVQPRCNPEKTSYKTSARDIAVLLDVSRSMLAADLQPSRLERAKLELSKLSDHLKGDRLGLIVFAGDAVIKCPLTSNYTYFKSVLRNVTPQSASQGGTRIGDAVRKALSDLLGLDRGESAPERGVKAGETVLEEERKGEKQTFADILLVTDGEDMDSYPVHAARRAADFNVGIYAVGLGSEAGSPIPIKTEEYIRSRDGAVVLSKLDSKTLRDMVTVEGLPRGSYWPVGTDNFDLVEFFDRTLAQESGREIVEEQVFWTEIFQPFLLAGLLLFLVYLLVPERPSQGRLSTRELSA
jgi:Ca-activated chloride channel family protein